MDILTQLDGMQQLLGAADRLVQIATCFAQAREFGERFEVASPQPGPLIDEPLVGAAVQQVARIQPDRRAQRGQPDLMASLSGEQLLEVVDVDPDRRVRAPA